MAETPIPITVGSGTASVASDLVAGASYQQIKVVDGTLGSNTALKVNPDGSFNASIIGLPQISISGGSVGLLGGTANIGNVGIAGSVAAYIIGGSIAGTFTTPNQSVSGTVGASIIGTVPVVQSGTVISSISGGISSVALVGANTVSVVGTLGASVLGWVPIQASNTSVISYIQNSVATVIIGGSIAASFTPPANQSVSGTVQTDVRSSVAVVIIGGSIAASFTPPANQSVSGTVQTDVRSSVAVVIIGGSIAASFTPPANQSVSGTVNIGTGGPVSVTGTMSVLGTVPVTQATASNPWVITGSVQGSFSPAANQSVSGTVGASIIGLVPVNLVQSVNQSVSGTVAVTGGPISITTIIPGTSTTNLGTAGAAASVAAKVGILAIGVRNDVPVTLTATDGQYVQGISVDSRGAQWVHISSTEGIQNMSTGNASVITVFQAPSIVGTYAEDAASGSGDKGFLVMGARNDTLASVTSADGDYSSHVVGPAGELISENAPLTKWVSGQTSIMYGASVAVIAAQGTSIFTYITGVQVANMSANSALITLQGASSSTLAFTIAPATGGSNIYFQNGLKTNANGAFTASISGVASVYLSAQGFISKT